MRYCCGTLKVQCIQNLLSLEVLMRGKSTGLIWLWVLLRFRLSKKGLGFGEVQRHTIQFVLFPSSCLRLLPLTALLWMERGYSRSNGDKIQQPADVTVLAEFNPSGLQLAVPSSSLSPKEEFPFEMSFSHMYSVVISTWIRGHFMYLWTSLYKMSLWGMELCFPTYVCGKLDMS